MILSGTTLAVVAVDEAACERVAAPLRTAGALVQCTIEQTDTLATLSEPGFDAIVLDVGEQPERFLPVAIALRTDPRTRDLPVVALPDPSLPSGRLARLGAVHVIAQGDEGASVPLLADLIESRRTALAAIEYARQQEERMRAAGERLTSMRTEAQTLAHDARALCGIVVGFAANLRDEIAGPLEPTQHVHVALIIDAANDTAALLERFVTTARAQASLPERMSSRPPPSRRVARRTMVDFAEIVRTTARLLGTMAAEKAIVLRVDAPHPVLLWGDSMQLKQVVTNLLVNAVKFTPRRGGVAVTVRSVNGSRPAVGRAGRSRAELIVRDTGPGIPTEERERVFQRGVRLALDVPGSGVGLAVVREIVSAHSGSVRAGEAPGGGAELTVELPLDIRSRREQPLLLVEEPAAARKVFAALRGQRDWTREALQAGSPLVAALETCRAVIVVPRGSRASLDEALEDAAPISARTSAEGS